MRDSRQDILFYGGRCRDQGLIINGDGNLSVRQDKGIWITPSGSDKGSLALEDLVHSDSQGTPLNGGRPSCEIGLHLALYHDDQTVQAVLHTHPLYATAMTLGGQALDVNLLTESQDHLTPLAYVDRMAPGSPDLVAAFKHALTQAPKAILLRGHGLVTWGRTMEEAFRLTLSVERLAHTQYLYETRRGGQT